MKFTSHQFLEKLKEAIAKEMGTYEMKLTRIELRQRSNRWTIVRYSWFNYDNSFWHYKFPKE